MARKFEKFQNPNKQYGLRATSFVSPGEVLYVAEPYAYTVKKSWWGEVCEFCLKSPGHLLRCSQCKFAKYCSKECQVASWPDHKRECKCIKNYKSFLDTDPVRLVGKMIFKMLRKSSCPSEELLSVSALERILIQEGSEIEDTLEWLSETLLIYLKEEITDPSQLPANVNLPELFAKVIFRGLIITNGELMGIATGLYPSTCLLKYSCEPNCTGVFMGRLLHVRAIRKIEAGEELTVSIVDQMMSTEEHQNYLRNRCRLECDCRRCRTKDKDENMLAGDKEASEETEQVVKKVLKLQSNNQWVESLDLCKAQLQRNVGRVPDENIYQLKMLDYAMDACMVLQLPEEAVRYGYRTLEPYRLYTTGISAAWAVQLIKIGLLLAEQGKTRKAVNMYKEALEDMKLFHGEDHPMTKKIIGILEIWDSSVGNLDVFDGRLLGSLTHVSKSLY